MNNLIESGKYIHQDGNKYSPKSWKVQGGVPQGSFLDPIFISFGGLMWNELVLIIEQYGEMWHPSRLTLRSHIV